MHVVRGGLTEKAHSSMDLKRLVYAGLASRAEGKASAKALRWGHGV